MTRCGSTPLRVSFMAMLLLLALASPAARANDNKRDTKWHDSVAAFDGWAERQNKQVQLRVSEAWAESRMAFAHLGERMRTEQDRSRVALSEWKEKLSTFGAEAIKALDRYRVTIDTSWAKMNAAAADTLRRIDSWMRGHSKQRDDQNIPV